MVQFRLKAVTDSFFNSLLTLAEDSMAIGEFTLTRKRGTAMIGLLVAAGLAAVGGGVDGALRAFGIGAAHGAEMSEGWLYLGRRSADRWRPPSGSISQPAYPVKPGNRVVVRQDALVYGSVDCKVTDAADFKADGTSRPVLLVTADRQGLEIAGLPIECPSIGRAKTVWVNVKIPANRLVRVER